MPATQTPQPTDSQVAVFDLCVKLWSDTTCTLRARMYPSGTMLLHIKRDGRTRHFVRVDEGGKILSVS